MTSYTNYVISKLKKQGLRGTQSRLLLTQLLENSLYI